MSRRVYFTSSRGRSPLLPSPVRLTRSSMANLDQIENIPSAIERSSEVSMPRKPNGRALLARANQTQRKTTESGTENESSDDEIADDEDDEASDEDDDGDDESDQPAAFAPSRGHRNPSNRKAGRLAEYRRMFLSEDPILYEDPYDLFRGPVEEDDEDDDVYRAVDDISDEDEQNDEIFQLNDAEVGTASLLREQSGSPFSLPDPEHEADFILDQVDGLSAYGFGDDLDTGDGSGEFSAPSEDGDVATLPKRHVHFNSDVEHMNAYGKSSSPSLTRALLPSAMLFETENHIYALDNPNRTSKHNVSVAAEDAYDSDATEVISRSPTPIRRTSSVTNLATIETKYTTATTANSTISNRKNKKATNRRRKGPPRGLFTVDQDKSWAVLDPTGKKILQIPAANTNRHAWLDEMSQSTSTPSSSTSPLNSTLKLRMEGVVDNVIAAASTGLVINTAIPDVMMAGLSGLNSFAGGDHGQTVGPPEAFYSSGLQLVGGDYAISPEPESDAYDEEATPIARKPAFPLEEFLEDLGDDELEEIDAELPLYAPADDNLTADNEGIFGHLNNTNVTAFRRSADPMSASRPGSSYSYDLQTTPITNSTFALPAVPMRTPTTSHKRKVSSTPYQDEKIYGNVTPVERKVIHVSSKRRKVAT